MTKVECPSIFLIEDDRDIRETTQEFLESEGYGVEAYANGKTALARLQRKPEPCLVLLDLMMPVMNGAEFMEEFKKLPVTLVPVPVYLCSATACLEDSERLACNGFIKKPVDLNVLLLIVENFCKRNAKAA